MSEMSRAQGPTVGYIDSDPTDDMVPPAARSPRDPDAENVGPTDSGSEDVGPQDFGSEGTRPEDLNPEDTNAPLQPPDIPQADTADLGDDAALGATQRSSDPMPDIAGSDQAGS